MSTGSKKRVVMIGVGGASCSGKTTLAKHLRSVLPGSFIIHQDDFAPPEQDVPYHPTLGIQDWDDPIGAIDWKRMVDFLNEVRVNGKLRDEWKTHDVLNPQVPVPISDEHLEKWRNKFESLQTRSTDNNEEIVWVLVDGFLLYWHPGVTQNLDLRLFLQVSYATLKSRRDRRFGYHTAEGSLWQDPPGYWDDIVWPAYLKAHKRMFMDGNVENGSLLPHDTSLEKKISTIEKEGNFVDGSNEELCGLPVSNLKVIQAEEESSDMQSIFEMACSHVQTLWEELL